MMDQTATKDYSTAKDVERSILLNWAGRTDIGPRLCNFVVGREELLPAHKAFLLELVPKLRTDPTSKLYAMGMASHNGDATMNLILSQNRARKIQEHFANFSGISPGQILVGATGEFASGGNSQDNDGKYRAVHLVFFDGKQDPPPIPNPPKAPPATNDWEILEFDDLMMALPVVRAGPGSITLRNGADKIQINFVAAGLNIGLGKLDPFGGSATATSAERLILSNLKTILKNITSMSLLKVGKAVKNPIRVSGPLTLDRLTEGLMFFWKGETGVFVEGVQMPIILFGVPVQALIDVMTFGGSAPGLLFLELLFTGKVTFPLPTAVGAFLKISPGPIGAALSASYARITSANFV